MVVGSNEKNGWVSEVQFAMVTVLVYGGTNLKFEVVKWKVCWRHSTER